LTPLTTVKKSIFFHNHYSEVMGKVTFKPLLSIRLPSEWIYLSAARDKKRNFLTQFSMIFL